ncbi:hypothetical protein PRIEUP_LOCUS17193, partial [Pristimantis euphronides]
MVLQYVSHQSDLHSVAIPAVSSGIFGFPLDLCANLIVQTVSAFCNSKDKGRLKEIRLVNNDDKTVQAMREACEKILGSSDTPSRPTASSHSAQAEPGVQKASPQISPSTNGLRLHLKTGRIEDEETYIIVNSISSDLNLSHGAISVAINNKAGVQLQREIDGKRKSHRHRNMISTKGYQLHCNYVYHVILPIGDRDGAEKTLREVTKECLMTAHKFEFPSISFPALGTGNVGLQKHRVADIMTQAALDFARGNACKLDVYFVIHPSDQDTFKAFQVKLTECGIITDKNMEFTDKRRGLEPSDEEMCVSMAGMSSEAVAEAAAWLQWVFSSSSPLLLHSNHLLLFGHREFDALASGPPSVEMEYLGDSRVAMKISGPRPDRVLAAIQVQRLLVDVQEEFANSLEEELLEAAVIWFYERQSESHRYPAKANRELEKAYISRTNVTLTAPGHVINFTNLTAEEREQKFTIRRRCLLDSLQNIQTSSMHEQWPSQTMPVDPKSQEFKDRSKEFRLAGFILEKMEKVQNKLLSGVFQSKKREVEQRQQKPSTQQLYQLVPRQFCRKICDAGFHRLYVTPRDSKYAGGIYFKKHLHNITQRFCVPEKDGLLCILQAEVLIGATTKSSKNQLLLPCVGSDALQVYECVVDESLTGPEYYVILNRFHANPQFVFTCR